MVFLHSLRRHPLGIKLGQLVPSQAWERRPSLFFSLCVFTLVSSLLLGGGTRGGFLSDTILELLAIPAFLMSLSSLVALPWLEGSRPAELALMFCLAIALLPLIQLVPLPPSIWTLLPQHQEIANVLGLVGRELPWLPISVAPTATWLSVLSLLPPMAVFLCVIQLSYRERRFLSLIFLGIGIVAAFVGLVQVAQGSSSPLRFFAFTNENEAVGFFANRNHFAALLYVLLLYGAAWATDVAFAIGSWSEIRRLETPSIAALTATSLTLVILIAAETITRSRAGLGLMIVGMFGAFALATADRRRQAGGAAIKLILGATIVAALLAVQFALYRILDRFSLDPLESARPVFVHNTITAALAYMPFGSGFGTFVSVYPMFEPRQDIFPYIYANHAHNDVLEVWLEGGAVAIILVVLFVIWLGLRFRQFWWRPPANVRSIDVLLARAATIAIALIIAHSFVDYPLRTDAMMAVLAFSCALLIEPIHGGQPTTSPAMLAESEPSHESAPALPLPVSSVPVADPWPVPAQAASQAADNPPVRQPAERWGEGIAWPEQWRNAKEQKPGAGIKNDPGDE